VHELTSVEAKAFVPSKDFALCKQFYQDLGFELAWSSDELAYLRNGNSSFLLQKFYQKEHAGNFMMHLLVQDVEAWWRHVRSSGLAAKVWCERRAAGGQTVGNSRFRDRRSDGRLVAHRTEYRRAIRRDHVARRSAEPRFVGFGAPPLMAIVENVTPDAACPLIPRLRPQSGHCGSSGRCQQRTCWG
jgi:hypothetical protein